jgi:hypothetical protein
MRLIRLSGCYFLSSHNRNIEYLVGEFDKLYISQKWQFVGFSSFKFNEFVILIVNQTETRLKLGLFIIVFDNFEQ